ncbi:glycosyltransferase family 2 protein [Flavobacterium luteolum]|uniref:glycosyltransferase family 2 protein n=1 Tax=Flavobacterium luteolum TaxID=3003259 RepID=UPI00248DD150|nr:glycosyltransferase family 2 protein [Flavobacterium luteolum]
MSNCPLVSVIVPNYNHENYLKQRLDSIFNQTYQNFEVILLDDCSTDESREILSKASKNPRVSHIVFNDKNTKNTFDQWRKGISLANGEYIWIAESDDFCDSRFIEILIKPLLENLEIVLSYCQSQRVNQNGEITGNWITHTDYFQTDIFSQDFVIEGNHFIENFLIFRNVIPNASAVIFKNSIDLDKYLQTENRFRYCGDWIFYFKIILNNKVAFINESLNSFRHHDKSVIATAGKVESRIGIIDIEIDMRAELMRLLKQKKIYNCLKIISNNKAIIKSLKCKKGILLIQKNHKLKGFLVIISVFDEFLRRYKIGKKIILKLKKIIS